MAEINTPEGKEEFIRTWFDRVRDKLIAEVPDMPDEWDGHHIRAMIHLIGCHERPHTDVGHKAKQELMHSDFYCYSQVV